MAAQPEGPPSPVSGAGEPQVTSSEPAPLPSASEVVPRLLDLEEEADRTRSELAHLETSVRQARDGEELVRRALELRQRLDALAGERDLDGDRVARLRAVGRKLGHQQEELLARVSSRFRRLEDLDARWRESGELWQRWGLALATEVPRSELAADLAQARALHSGVRQELAAVLPLAREAQRQAQAMLRESRGLELEIERLLADWSASLRRRSGAPLLSTAFLAELRQPGTPGHAAGVRALAASFFDREALTLILQALVALLVAFAARWLHRSGAGAAGEARGTGREPLARPWALGLLAAVAGFGSWYEPAAGRWRLLPAVVLALALVLLATALFDRRRTRSCFYLLAGLWLGFELLCALELSWAVSRLALLALAVVPLVLLVPVLRREQRELEQRDRRRHSVLGLSLRLAVLLLVVVALAEGLGFHALAWWLFRAGLRTAVMAFVLTLFLRVSRTLVRLAARQPWLSRRPSWHLVRDEVERRVERALKVMLVLAAGLFAADIWHLADSPLAAWRSVLAWNASVGSVRITCEQVLLAGVALYIALALSWLLRRLLDERLASGRETERGVTDSIKALLHYSLALLGGLLALSMLGVEVKTFALVAGAFGVGIGFGLQNIVSNFVSGIILLFERPVRTGDVVVVAGETGEVRRIGLRSTVIQTLDRSEVIVPNSQLVAEKVTNWTLSSSTARLALPVGVAYGSPIERVEELLLEIAAQHPQVLTDPAPTAPVVALGESSVNLELRVFVGQLDHRPRVTSELAKMILQRFAADGIVIPVPQREVFLKRSETEA